MIDRNWLDRVLATLRGSQSDAGATAQLAETLGERAEVLPHLAEIGALADWPETRAALTRASQEVPRASSLRPRDPLPGWQDTTERRRLIADMEAMILASDPHRSREGEACLRRDMVLRIDASRRAVGHSVDPAAFITWDPTPPASAQPLQVAVNDRMGEIVKVAMDRPAWWRLLPRRMRRRSLRRAVEKAGLFDGAAYLARYPDVAAAGADPLQHYMLHGRNEGRVG